MTGYCIVCGIPSQGVRCSKHHGAFLLLLALEETAERDAALLRMRDEEGLSLGRIADRYGVSKTRAGMKVREARRRQEKRKELAL